MERDAGEGRGDAVDGVAVLRETLASHRSVLTGALSGNDALDIDGAYAVHAGLARIIAHWDEFTAGQQRRIVETVEFVVSDDSATDGGGRLHDPDGFAADLARLDSLRSELGYA